MKVVVLNGSPKGGKSVTLQYVHDIRRQFPRHELNIIDITQSIHRLANDAAKFDAVIDQVRFADAIVWATPVYFFLVPAGYKRFIELIFARGAGPAFQGKPAGVLTTSIHFFDHTAHNYLHAICDDLGMRYAGGFSADMYDLLIPVERQRLHRFADGFFAAAARRHARPRAYPRQQWSETTYLPVTPTEPVDTHGQRIAVITDGMDPATNQGRMVVRLMDVYGGQADIIDLTTLDVKGSCLGCLHCAWDNQCVYANRDAYVKTYRERIMRADILIWAGTLKDRYLSWRWKQFFDRSFFMNHTPSLTGKQIGIVISGPFSTNANLRQILFAYAELQQAGLVDIVTDEGDDSAAIDATLDALARRLVDNKRRGYVPPPTFLGVAGARLFRDEIWGRLRFPFQADYRSYRRLNLFDFPQKNLKSRLFNAAMLILSRHPRFRREVNRRMKDEMIRPLANVLTKKTT